MSPLNYIFEYFNRLLNTEIVVIFILSKHKIKFRFYELTK